MVSPVDVSRTDEKFLGFLDPHKIHVGPSLNVMILPAKNIDSHD